MCVCARLVFPLVLKNCVDVPLCAFTAVDCGALTNPVNGMVVVSTTTFMSTATYTCDTGYMLSEDVTRTCGSDMMWSGNEPTCDRKLSWLWLSCIHASPLFLLTAVDCGALTNPGNGMVVVSTTTFMSTATYTCNTGYMLSEDVTRTCGSDMMWSGNEPTCDCELH